MSTYGAAAVWAPSGPTSAPDVRLTRRGRLARSGALAALVVLLGISVADVVGGGRALAADAHRPVPSVPTASWWSTGRLPVAHRWADVARSRPARGGHPHP